MPSTQPPADSFARTQPESFRARELTASLTAKDIEKSLAWYRDILGFTVHQRHERDGTLRAVSLKAGGVRLLISLDDGAKGADRVKGQGISLMLTTAQPIDLVAGRIEARGGTLADPPSDTPHGTRAFRLVDPDGFRLVISSEPKR